jgi:three-Cys-motif partner protein
LKLVLNEYYVGPYLNILCKNGFRVAYVDLFAGPGLNLIGEKKVPLPGSPLIPMLSSQNTQYRFSKFIFSDMNHEYIRALNKRCSDIDPSSIDIDIREEDANLVVRKLPAMFDEYKIDHALIFIDPEGMEFSWESMEELKTVNCDLIINFPSAGLQRNLHNAGSRQIVRRFLGLGDDEVPTDANEEWAIKHYRKKLASIGKDISTEISVHSGDSYHYHLIPAVRKTTAGSPWFGKIFPPVRSRIENLTGKVLGIITDQIDGTQEPL